MLVSIALGLLTAAVVSLPPILWTVFPYIDFYHPLSIVAVTLTAILMLGLLRERKDGSKSYFGFSDAMIHIHSSATPDSPARWTIHGMISFLFYLMGGVVGIEGAAAELAHSAAMRFQARSARWYEQRRRSDASTAIAAAIAATFHAPFAAILFPLELGLGGRALSSLLSALSAYLSVEFISHRFTSLVTNVGGDFSFNGALDTFHFSGWQSWLGPLILGVAIGVLSVLLIRLIRQGEDVLAQLFPRRQWLRPLLSGLILALGIRFYAAAHAPSWNLVQEVFAGKWTLADCSFLLVALTLSLVMVISGFGSLGILSPLFALGAIVGYGFNQWGWAAQPGFSSAAGLMGVAAIWGAVLGAPVSASILVFEMTHQQSILLSCLIAAFAAQETRRLLLTPPLYELELEGRGLRLIEGRSASVLETLYVRDAMVTDQTLIHEHEPISDIHQRLEKSIYAFLPVVNSQGKYLGMLTADSIQDAWEAQRPDKFVSGLVVAKDILYRAGLKVPSIGANDCLSATVGIFKNFPCVPAVSEEGRVVGLLFVYSVRLSYDREVARRSLSVGPVLGLSGKVKA